jgi:hypothetical protein
MVFSKRKTGFIGLIIINILSVEFIIEFLYLLTYKLSEDHIETFFCAIRSKGFQNTLTILTMLLPTFVATYAFGALFQILHYYRRFLYCKTKMLCTY